MAIPSPTTGDQRTSTPRWGWGDVFIGLLAGEFAAALLASVIIGVGGYDSPKDLPLAVAALANIPLWAFFIGVPIYVSATKGRGWITDFRVAISAWDVPLAIAAGLVTQFIIVPLVSAPFLILSGQDQNDVERPARELIDKAHGSGGVIILLLMVGLMAPFAEELFFRGLALRSEQKRTNTGWALFLSSALFAATHFQVIQFPALLVTGAVFGLLVLRTGRLGTSMVAHATFNISSVVVLLWMK